MEVMRGSHGYHGVLFSPYDQGWNLDIGEAFVQPLAPVLQVLQEVMDGISIAALEVLPIGKLD